MSAFHNLLPQPSLADTNTFSGDQRFNGGVGVGVDEPNDGRLTVSGRFTAVSEARVGDGTDVNHVLRFTGPNNWSVTRVAATENVEFARNGSVFFTMTPTGQFQTGGLRINQAPAAGAITPTHTVTVNLNGTDYKIPVVAA